MTTSTRLIFALLVATASPMAFAQQGIANPNQTAQFEVSTGPLTVHWGQPADLPNAADYRVTVADLDRNDDNRISRREVPRGHALEAEFKLVDRNHDGYITQAELANWR
ncbi:EF-hand domain-containing protein [Arenimonas oryziterrae]|uniref:EF-hand domain-containing protein n=1 Tax=Arenimonas oryziterrae DSM 21050 = YC6267 TaxID=1121015 RepID=A0A091ATN7_9GAMM|nr:EF-hand domain-containing protein [Arenimonas oryziterrae]KFN42522.1 hypothetical protein N789_12850 [Arenimonas oryziterrae DSM 21050 = YC6267]